MINLGMPLLNKEAVELVDLDNRGLVVFQIFLKIFLEHLARVVSAKAEGMICATMLQST